MGASIPTYDHPQAELAPLAAPRQYSVASPEIFNHAATEQANAARAAGQAGQALEAAAIKMRERDDADSVFRAETALKDQYLQQEQDWRQNKQGRFAKGLTTEASQWWTDNIKKTSEGLTNQNQQRLFMQRAQRYREASLNTVAGFESRELEKSHDEAWNANKNVTISTAAAAPTAESVANARNEITTSNRYQAARKGWEPEVLQAQNTKDLTALHTQVIQSLARTNPTAAKAYFEANKGEIDGAQHAELGKFAQQATATAIGEKAADDVWASKGPKYDTQPANQDEMEAEIRKQFKDDEFAKKAAISALHERVQAFDKGRAEREASNESTVWKAVGQGASVAQVQAMPEFVKLKGERQTAIKEHIEAQAQVRDSRREADLARKNFAAYAVYSKPENLDRMSEDQIINLTDSLGTQLTGHLLEKKRSMTGKTLQANMDQQDFDHIAQEVGLRPFDPKKDEKERAQLGELKFRVEQIINTEQDKLKRPLSREEKMTLMRREFDNQVMVHNTIFPDEKKSLIMLTPDQIKDAYVTVDGERVKLSSIPSQERSAIIQARQQRGLPISEQAIAETWLRARQTARKRSPQNQPSMTGVRG